MACSLENCRVAYRDEGNECGSIQLFQCLGKGAFSTVYQMQFDFPGRSSDRAIKILNSTENCNLLTREKNLYSRVHQIGLNPFNFHIIQAFEQVQLFDFEQALCGFGLVLEDGGTSLQVLADQKWFDSSKKIAQVASQILRGLEALEVAGVVHTDLKESNILMSDRLVVKICDLGSACILSEKGSFETSLKGEFTSLYYRPP